MFHVSRQFVGNSVDLRPQVPRGAPKYEDNRTRRICVSPTVEQCVVGIFAAPLKVALKLLNGKNFYIYKTDSWDYIPAKDVFDHEDTDEHWFLQPTNFKLYGTVCAKAAAKGVLQINKIK